MKKILFCILPFILIWGGCISLFVPQITHEYLGTVNSDIKEIKKEIKNGNKYYFKYTYVFKYNDINGIERSSDGIVANCTWKSVSGFETDSTNDWIVKQLYTNKKVYAPGIKPFFLILSILFSISIPFYFILIGIHISCITKGDNFHCGSSGECFGCPFCVTDKDTVYDIKPFLTKSKTKTKHFFGY